MTADVRADVSCWLLEVDFSGIEAVLTGWYLWRHGFSAEGAKQYIRLARLGMHAAVTSLKVDQPVDLTADDLTVKANLDRVKKAFPKEYDTSKRTVHANNFGMTTYGMVEKFPEFFPTLKAAEIFQGYYYALAPDLPKWHAALRKRAREIGYLGGTPEVNGAESIWNHPYGYRHWFWDVLNYQPCNEFTARKWLKDPTRAGRIVYMHGRPFKVAFGGDGNRVIALYPQSTAAGRLKEAELDLFLPWSDTYVGDAYFGRTPLLGPIHDSLLLHLPDRCLDRVAAIIGAVMQRPSARLPIPAEWGWGPSLPIGVSAKVGRTWGDMEDLKLDAWVAPAAVSSKISHDITHEPDHPVLPRDDDADDDWNSLKRSVA